MLSLVIRLVVPVQSIVLHLGTRGIQRPPKSKLDILNQMARDFDRPDVGRMVERADIVMLQDAGGVEVVHERGAGLVGDVRVVLHRVV